MPVVTALPPQIQCVLNSTPAQIKISYDFKETTYKEGKAKGCRKKDRTKS